MATYKSSTAGYNTYILSTAKSVVECSRILVYNRDNLLPEDNVGKISIYNLNEVVESLRKLPAKKYVELNRERVTDPFLYKYQERIGGFNVIVYLDVTGRGLGFTEFINTQGKIRDTKITLSFSTKTGEDVSVVLSNSLDIIKDSEDKSLDRWIGNEPWNYVTNDEVKKFEPRQKKTLFTTHLSSFNNRDESNIWLGYGNVLTNGRVCSLYLLRGANINPYNYEFSNAQIGYYQMGELCYYSWVDNKYCIISLCSKNRFGNPTNYTSGRAYKEITDWSDGYRIIMFSGRYAIVSKINETGIYDTVTETWVKSDVNKIKFINEIGRLFEFSPSVKYDNIIREVPSLRNTYLNLKDSYINNFGIVGKIGDWFIFLQGKVSQDEEDIYILSSYRQTVKILASELPRLLIINSNYLGLFSEDRSYITVYSGLDNNWESELEKQQKTNGVLVDKKVGEVTIKVNSTIEGIDDVKYNTAYSNGTLMVIDTSKPVINTWFNKFRRGIIVTDHKLPLVREIVGSYSGILFYLLDDNYINYI